MITETMILLFLVELQRDLRKALSTETLRKDFDSIVTQTFSRQSPTELIKGQTPFKKLCVLKTALQNFEDKHNLGMYNGYVTATFKFAEQMIKSLEHNKCKTVPATTSDQDRKIVQTSNVQAAPANMTQKSVSAAKISPSKQKKMPAPSKQRKIYATLLDVFNSGKQILKGKHITCHNSGCSYCQSLFMNIPLTKCNHKVCAPGGWYPHVGERLWKNLLKYHDVPGSIFVPKENAVKDGQLPSVVTHKVQNLLMDTSIPSTSTIHTTPSECSESTIRSSRTNKSDRSKATSSASRYTPMGRRRIPQTPVKPWIEELPPMEHS